MKFLSVLCITASTRPFLHAAVTKLHRALDCRAEQSWVAKFDTLHCIHANKAHMDTFL